MKTELIKEFELVASDAAEKYHDNEEIFSLGYSNNIIKITAFISCYNEQDFIIQTLDDVCKAMRIAFESYEVIVIDDCSSDQSSELVKKYIIDHPLENIILRHNFVNRGLAQNFIDAAFMGKGEYYKLFCGDNTEPVSSIIKICELAGDADIIIPNYSIVEDKSRFRIIISNTYTFLINKISGNNIKYYNGLHLHKRFNILRWHPNTRGFGFQADIVCMLLANGATYKEVSVLAVNNSPSLALNWRNFFSVCHTMLDIFIRRIAAIVYEK